MMNLVGVRYVKDVTYEVIPDSNDVEIEHDVDDFGPIIHVTEVNSLRPRICPVGCVALFESENGTHVMSYSVCSKEDRNNFSKKLAKRYAEERACKKASNDAKYNSSASDRYLFLNNEELLDFPAHLRRSVIIAEYDLLKDLDMATARSSGILPKIERN